MTEVSRGLEEPTPRVTNPYRGTAKANQMQKVWRELSINQREYSEVSGAEQVVLAWAKA